MKINSKKSTRSLGIFVLSMVVAMGFSCKKEKVEPHNNPNNNGGNNPVVLEATATVNYITEGVIEDFQYYHKLINFHAATIIDDSTLQMFFYNTDVNGETSEENENAIIIEIVDKNGFQYGNIYSINDNPANRKVQFFLNDSYTYQEGEEFSKSLEINNFTNNATGSVGQLKITSVSLDNIQGVFNFQGSSPSSQPMEIKVSNGEFNCKLQRLND